MLEDLHINEQRRIVMAPQLMLWRIHVSWTEFVFELQKFSVTTLLLLLGSLSRMLRLEGLARNRYASLRLEHNRSSGRSTQ